MHLPGPGHSVLWVRQRVQSQVCCVSPLGSWSQLLCDTPGTCEPPRIPGRHGLQLATCSQFGERYSLWGQDYSSPLPYSSGCPTASLPQGREGPKCSQLALLWYSLGHNPSFSTKVTPLLSMPGVTMGSKSLSQEGSFCFYVCLSGFGLLSHISPFRLSSGIQAQSLP